MEIYDRVRIGIRYDVEYYVNFTNQKKKKKKEKTKLTFRWAMKLDQRVWRKIPVS